MNMNKEQIRKQFSRHASEYDQYARVQKELAAQLIQMIEGKSHSNEAFQRILEIGCGTGFVTELLVERYPDAELVVIDISEEMVMKTKQKLADTTARIKYIIADAEELSLNEPFDLIISNAAFQWFNHPRDTVLRYLDCLVPHGIFAFTTFGPRTFNELHMSFERAEQQLNLASIRHGQQFFSEQYWSSLFADRTTELESIVQERVEHYSSVRNFLYQVKKVGAGNASISTSKGMAGGRILIEQMEKYYTETFGSEDGIQATYDLYSGVFKKN